MLWDRCIELGIEARKKLREFGRYYAETAKDAEEQWFFDPFVPDVVTIRGSTLTDDATDVAWERPADRRAQARAAVLDLRPEERVARLCRLLRRLRDGRPQQAHAADAGHRPQDRRVPRLRRAGDRRRQLPARAARRAGEVRPEQHPVPDDAGRRRKQAQHADRASSSSSRTCGTATRRSARCCRRSTRRTANATPATRCGRSATRCTTSTAGERQGAAAPLFPRDELSRDWRCRRRTPTRRSSPTTSTTCRSTQIEGRISATLALIYPPGIGVVVPANAGMSGRSRCSTTSSRSRKSFNRFPGFNYEVQGVYQEREDGRIRFYTYVVRE